MPLTILFKLRQLNFRALPNGYITHIIMAIRKPLFGVLAKQRQHGDSEIPAQ